MIAIPPNKALQPTAGRCEDKGSLHLYHPRKDNHRVN